MHHRADFQPPQPVRYTVRFPASPPHYVSVEAIIPVDPTASNLELFLPVWTPGSYLVREYSRHIEGLTAEAADRSPLTITKTRKNRWQLQLPQATTQVTISYLLYCHDLTVRTNYRDETLAMLQGAATLLTSANLVARPHEVKLELPDGWKSPSAPLTFQDYDHLVDFPIAAGNPTTASFEIDGKPHILLNFGDSIYWNLQQAVEDLRKIVLEHRAMWGFLPYQRYRFLNLVTGGRGALEHRDSMLLLASIFAMRSPDSYRNWLDTVSHEFFHLWNAKRLRPVELGPFDYENEVYTRNLWIVEGFTEYYGPLAVCRAGLVSETEFLGTNCALRGTGVPESLSGWIENLQNTPGRLYQPVAQASFDAWIKFYRPDENSRNCSVSYYTKGAIIAWLLDAKTRAATDGAKSLDDIMRLAYARYGGEKGYSTEDFRLTAEEVAGIHLKQWFAAVADSTDELDYGEALAWFGLRFKEPPPAKPSVGLTTKTEECRTVVKEVFRDGPACEAGVSPGDVILGIDEQSLTPAQWPSVLENFRPGDTIALQVSRRERILRLPVRIGETPPRRWLLEVRPDSSQEQRRHLKDWLKSGYTLTERAEP